jgi:hypothetical protein
MIYSWEQWIEVSLYKVVGLCICSDDFIVYLGCVSYCCYVKVPADAHFLCDDAAALGMTVKERPCVYYLKQNMMLLVLKLVKSL